jgi:hypothetical protein
MIGMLPSLKLRPVIWNYSKPFGEQYDLIVSRNAIDMSMFVDKQFAGMLKEYEINYISKFDAFSLKLPDDLIVDGQITYSDQRHISYKGEQIFGERFTNNMVKLGYVDFKPNIEY